MGNTPDKFTHRSLQDTESIAAYLEAVLEGIRQGRLNLESGGREMVLEPSGLLRFRVDARRGSYRSRITVKISWRDESPEATAPPLAIKPESKKE